MERLNNNPYEGEHVRGSAEGSIDFDMYPRQKGETPQEYGARLKWMRAKSAEVAEKLGEPEGADAAEDQGELTKMEKYEAHLRRKQEMGVYTAEEVDKMLKNARGAFEKDEKEDVVAEDKEEAIPHRWEMPEGHHTIMLEDGRTVMVPEEVRDEQDYAEYLEEQRRRKEEMGEAAVNAAEIDGEDELTKKEMLAELTSAEALKWLLAQKSDLKVGDLLKLQDHEVKALYDKWQEFKDFNEKDEARKKMLAGDGLRWLAEKMPGAKTGDILKMSDEELVEKYREWQAEADSQKNDEPLKLVTIDKTRDAKSKARDIAETMLQEDLREGGKLKRFVKGIWKGQMFREYFLLKNEQKVYEVMTKEQDENFANMSEEERAKSKEFLIKRFISEYDEMRSEGEEQKLLGEDHKITKLAKGAIERFAKGGYGEGELNERNFIEDMKNIKRMLNEEEGLSDTAKGEIVIDNYLEIARAAKGRYEHEEGLDNILKGFDLVYGESRGGARAEAHQSAVEKLVNRYERGALTKFMPPEAVAAAAGIGVWLAQSLGTSAAKAALFGFGGAAVTGAVAAVKEGGRVKKDRAHLARELALGGTGGESGYDLAMKDAIYDTEKASDLTMSLREAMNTADKAKILEALARVEARNQMSDEENIDLIAFGAEANVEEERFVLALARAEALAKLKELGVENAADELKLGVEAAREVLDEELDVKDELFRKLRHKQMAKAGVKAAATSAAMMIGTQELVAAFSDKLYGIADAARGLERNPGEATTMMAGILGFDKVNSILPEGSVLGREELAALEEKGYTLDDLREQGYVVEDVSYNTVRPSTEVVNDLSTQQYAEQYGTLVSRDSWLEAGNLEYNSSGDGIMANVDVSKLAEQSGGMSLEQMVDSGQIKAIVSLSEGTQAMPIELVGKVVEGSSKIEFVPAAGSVIPDGVFDDGSFGGKFFELVLDNGVDAEGVQHLIPLSTLRGPGLNEAASFSGSIITEVTERIPKFNVIGPDVVAKVSSMGVAAMPIYGRENLTNAIGGEMPSSGDEASASGAENANEATSASKEKWDRLSPEVGGDFGAGLLSGEMDSASQEWRNILFDKWWGELSEQTRERFVGESSDLVPDSPRMKEWLEGKRETPKAA